MRNLTKSRRQSLGLIVAAAVVLATGASGGPATAVPTAPAATGPTNTYIVQLADLPLAGYTGNIAGLKATKPAAGTKFNGHTADANKYRNYLRSRHDTVAQQVGVTKVYDYSNGFNGFSAKMTVGKAAQLARTPGVLSVSKNETRQADTVSTPAFLGLDKPGGLWSQLGGPSKAGGKDIVIGDIDSGIWPESASFRPLANPGRLTDFSGSCAAAEQWTPANCSNKIVSARYYNQGLGGNAAIKAAPYVNEVASARDINGHGSHTASTAAGDYNTDMIVNGNSLGKGSGMAPAARIAVYKALWHTGASASGSTADLVQAIEDAILDGVDVINYSISGSTSSDVDPVEIEFMYAAAAGIFVSASAGNSGPGSSTVAHNSPWLTTVAAGTHDRAFQAGVTLGNGTTYSGVGLGAAVPSSPVVLSTNAALTGADPTSARLCLSKASDPKPAHVGFLDPAKVAGKIVVCDRGSNARTDKSDAVKEAGGVGMVLANTSPNSLNADLHSVPTVHVNETDGAAIKAYVNSTGSPTASLAAGHKVVGAEAPTVAAFSSRGPAIAGQGDLLKPDIMAPGVDVLAAVSPASSSRNFDFLSGTSMAAPHITGIAALLLQLHPRWSPMMIKSALMTSSSILDNKGNPITTDAGGPAGAFDYGSGHVTPNSAADPGLVYDSGPTDWIRFLCGTGELPATNDYCRIFGTRDPSDLNTPNVAIGDLAGAQTVTRTVTNVGSRRATYKATVTAPAGITATVSPSELTISPGRSASYKVKFTRTTAPYGTYAAGSLKWTDGRHSVRSQLVVRPVGVKAPAEISGTGTSGQAAVPVQAGFTGTLTASVAGLVPGTARPATLTNPGGSGGFQTGNPLASAHTAKYTVTVPAGTTLARFATFDADVPAGTDLDLFVYRAGTANLVGSSAGGTAQEQVDLANPTAGSYDVYVDLFALAAGNPSQAINEFDWQVGSTPAGNLTATPASRATTVGDAFTVTAAWSGLTAGTRYLGSLSYGDGTSTLGRTVVGVNP